MDARSHSREEETFSNCYQEGRLTKPNTFYHLTSLLPVKVVSRPNSSLQGDENNVNQWRLLSYQRCNGPRSILMSFDENKMITME
ncbi:unnamed protein product [Caenorhabditis nigoni]